MRRFYFDTRGQYSGGGTAVVANCLLAAERHAILQGSRAAGDVPFFMRNVPVRGSLPHGPYVWGPQNALPWSRHVRGTRELLLVGRLRLASEWYGRRALAQFRTSSAIPVLTQPCSPVLHNVLDTGFEEALAASQSTTFEPAIGHIVCIGSGYSYRNLAGLLAGYERYREMGGSRPLFVGGARGGRRAQQAVVDRAASLPDVRLHGGVIARSQFLAALRDAAAVVLPSLVEASPLSALEACALSRRVVMSDIVGHREILESFAADSVAGDSSFFSPTDPGSLATALLRAVSADDSLPWHAALASDERRARARHSWTDDLALWLGSVAEEGNGHG